MESSIDVPTRLRQHGPRDLVDVRTVPQRWAITACLESGLPLAALCSLNTQGSVDLAEHWKVFPNRLVGVGWAVPSRTEGPVFRVPGQRLATAQAPSGHS